jgi:hypothetical protein
LWRCRRCRRAQTRPAPHDRCLAWRCEGALVFEPERADNYDLSLLDSGAEMVRPREHSAQITPEDREVIERQFKGEGEAVNTLVCTPTLELGVDIGSLDAVLMRNVPPLPANYWQRAGRAGRRHRMAVNVTYARAVSHDRSYFSEPSKLLEGLLEPPQFNLKNEAMVAKHVHATVLTRLHRLAADTSPLAEPDRTDVTDTLKRVLPRQIKDYLFDEEGNVRSQVFDASGLARIIEAHRPRLIDAVQAVFAQGWPAEDVESVSGAALERHVSEMGDQLVAVIRTLKRRLDWALDQMHRLEDVRRRKGTLDIDEQALYRRCDRLVKRYKGLIRRERQEAEGYDDTNTYAALAAEGFLPGYGLEIGSVRGTAQLPRHYAGSAELPLPRPPAVALREYVPGNLIYANGHRFLPRFFHLRVDREAAGGSASVLEPTVFRVDVASQAIVEAGSASSGVATGLGAATLKGIPICDVDLSHVSQISDEEDYRFQMPVAVYGYELERHGSGRAYQWGPRDLFYRRGVHFRLVNVGPARQVAQNVGLGYPVCLVCGQSRSPFASQVELQHFADDHRQRCNRAVERIGFFSDIVADAISIPGCETPSEAYSVTEALRTGATRILDMDHEDLDILVIRHPGGEIADALLYDPMPGGSGLLEQICARFGEVTAAALEVCANCPADCATACVDCLHTFRNAFFHQHLNRHLAADRLQAWGSELAFAHGIPAKLPAAAGDEGDERTAGDAEERLKRLLQRAGFADPAWHHEIQLGKPLGSTSPDCFYTLDEPSEPGVAIYLDGLSSHIHGNPRTRERDQAIRTELRARGYWVLEIAASQLTDRDAMTNHFTKLARVLMGQDRAREIRADDRWYEQPSGAGQSEN